MVWPGILRGVGLRPRKRKKKEAGWDAEIRCSWALFPDFTGYYHDDVFFYYIIHNLKQK